MPRSRSANRRRANAVLALVVAPSLLVAVAVAALYLVVLPLFPALHHYYFPESTRTYATYRVAILGHIVFGAVALTLGPLNLWNGLRRRHRRAHRRIGAVYAVAVSLAATFGFFMAFHAYPGTMPHGRLLITSGLATLAVVWLATLGAAVHAAAVRRDVDRHAFWIIVNVSATYSAVLFRLLNGVLVALDRFHQLYPVLGFAGWVPSVAVGVVLARRHAARSRRSRAGRTVRVAEPAGVAR
jgi:hypothetical protein